MIQKSNVKREKKVNPCEFHILNDNAKRMIGRIKADDKSRKVLNRLGFNKTKTPGSCKVHPRKEHGSWNSYWVHVIRFHYKELKVKPLGKFKLATPATCSLSKIEQWARVDEEIWPVLMLPSENCPSKVTGACRKICPFCNSE